MLTVDDYATIRLAHRDGMSIRESARAFHHSRGKVRQILAQPQPKTSTRRKPPPAPRLGFFHAIIDSILADDESAPPKQRHTAMQEFRRLRDEYHYSGGYDQVRRYVGKHRRYQRETFIPLAHDLGQRLECDFGHIHVDFPDGRRLVPVRIAAWAYSNYGFALATPTERTEAILTGMVAALGFFGCVPREVWWDNPTTVVRLIFQSRDRRPNAYYAALASHYAFEALFCMLAWGNEKPRAETRVRVLQRQWAAPVPRVVDLATLNVYLHRRYLGEAARGRRLHRVNRSTLCAGPGPSTAAADAPLRCLHQPAGARGQGPDGAFRPLQPQRLEYLQIVAQGDKDQTVRFDGNRYSVPRSCAYRTGTVKGYIDRVEIIERAQVVARHARSYGRDEHRLDPLHYLATLSRRPAALDHAPVLRHWQLPESFARLRQRQKERHGHAAGGRHFVRVLQLLGEHPQEPVQAAVEACLRRNELHAERVEAELWRLADVGQARPVTPLCQFQVPRRDLGRFDQLLSQGEEHDG